MNTEREKVRNALPKLEATKFNFTTGLLKLTITNLKLQVGIHLSKLLRPSKVFSSFLFFGSYEPKRLQKAFKGIIGIIGKELF